MTRDLKRLYGRMSLDQLFITYIEALARRDRDEARRVLDAVAQRGRPSCEAFFLRRQGADAVADQFAHAFLLQWAEVQRLATATKLVDAMTQHSKEDSIEMFEAGFRLGRGSHSTRGMDEVVADIRKMVDEQEPKLPHPVRDALVTARSELSACAAALDTAALAGPGVAGKTLAAACSPLARTLMETSEVDLAIAPAVSAKAQLESMLRETWQTWVPDAPSPPTPRYVSPGGYVPTEAEVSVMESIASVVPRMTIEAQLALVDEQQEKESRDGKKPE